MDSSGKSKPSVPDDPQEEDDVEDEEAAAVPTQPSLVSESTIPKHKKADSRRRRVVAHLSESDEEEVDGAHEASPSAPSTVSMPKSGNAASNTGASVGAPSRSIDATSTAAASGASAANAQEPAAGGGRGVCMHKELKTKTYMTEDGFLSAYMCKFVTGTGATAF